MSTDIPVVKQCCEVIGYNGGIVNTLIEIVTFYDDKIVIEFKSGVVVEVLDTQYYRARGITV